MKGESTRQFKNADDTQNQITFVPQINPKSKKLVRNEPIDKVLLDDAQRRKEKKLMSEK